MRLYNTMSKRKEEFVPVEEGKVRMYVCRTNRIQLYSYW